MGSDQCSLVLRALRARPEPLTAHDLEAVLSALVEPPLTWAEDPEIRHKTGVLYGRVLTDPSPVVIEVSTEIFADATDLFRSLVRACLPAVPDEAFFWRYTCAPGAFIFAQSFQRRIAYATHETVENTDWRVVSRQIVAFMVAGLQAA